MKSMRLEIVSVFVTNSNRFMPKGPMKDAGTNDNRNQAQEGQDHQGGGEAEDEDESDMNDDDSSYHAVNLEMEDSSLQFSQFWLKVADSD